MKNKQQKSVKSIILLSVIFLIVAAAGLYLGGHYISCKLLQYNEAIATDLALIVKNNFEITDAEVLYMKSLTFNEMEVDPINRRLMDVGNGVALHAAVSNVYLLAPLTEEEYRYCPDKETADFLGFEMDTPLNGVWLLNGKINSDGVFEVAQRDDIYRYTALDNDQLLGMTQQQPFGTYTADAWGSFITGYAPIYTVEGSFVGLLGIDMDPDSYQRSAQSMILLMIMLCAVLVLLMLGLFVFFYLRYVKAKEGQLRFEFYSRMSHDMRTPMNAILGMTALSKDETDVSVLHHNFQLVEESGTYMLGLINDTLDYQQIEAGRLALEPKITNRREILGSIKNMLQPAADDKAVELQIINKNLELDSFSYVDPVRITQIFMNLASNAIKFTPSGGTIKFVMECLGTEGDIEHNCYRIIDTGMGISPEFLKNKLFKPFQQEINAMASQSAGTGLGLAITKSLVELMGGRIEAESEPGHGSTFSVYLDIQKVEQKAARAADNTRLSAEKSMTDVLKDRQILLCEDHPINAEITRCLIESVGGHITIAENGQVGLDIFESSAPRYFDAILMDIHMPVMDGLEATRRMRASSHPDAKNIPIIALTANAYEEDIKSTKAAGMNAHLTKPVTPDLLFGTLVEKILQRT